jgi:hypothetical protein
VIYTSSFLGTPLKEKKFLAQLVSCILYHRNENMKIFFARELLKALLSKPGKINTAW